LSSDPDPQFLYLVTRGWKTGKQHKVEIWFVKNNSRYYIVSECRKNAHWVQNIMHNTQVSFTVNNVPFKGTARIVVTEKEPKLTNQISKLMEAKYGWGEGLIIELIPCVESSTGP
jgi:deazaflavin-dependent oxidoreductase (nitroreductase family)